MNVLVLYLLLLKATVTTFSGLASLPALREDLVVNRHVLTDTQLNTAVVVTRTTPGPAGLYVVSVGYSVAGTPGALAGWLAMCTPALIIIPLVHFAGHRADNPRVRSIIRAVILSSAGLLWAATVPLAQAAITDPFTAILTVASVIVLLTCRIESFWVILGAAVLQIAAAAFRLPSGF